MSGAGLVLGLVGPVPPPLGGMAAQTRQLADLLRAEGVTVVELPTNGPYRPSWLARVPVARALGRLLPYLLSVWRLAGRVDVIHLMANSGWSWQLFAAPVLWIARWRGTPVVVNYRGGEARDYLRRSLSRVRPSLRRASALVVPSGFLQGVFADFGFSAQVVPNIVDTERFRPQEPPHAGEGFTVIVTRHLERIYGLETALRAVALAAADIPGLRLVVAGDGPLRGELEARARELGVSGRVEFTGQVDRDEILALYRGADALLNPTTVDNMPNSVLEALASGVAVVSTDAGGVPHVVTHGETALLCPVGDAEAMAACLVRLYREPGLRADLVGAGLEHVRQFSWPRVRERWLATYARVAGEAGA
ncbi:glycosyltransferase family 4 protein [Parahaliea mediterranea]|uniref:Glycosyltransferase family 4 protein n=1 Tax=Parahaliea mediterranea TaxID=651086 RepID=A0A939IJA5_9GAMM|nr:glycosyltransferase family 4 protein [Parahaliea mediterranea]MBN7797444.1 glycosyltransferase family 4 protein [Parahaliea mediterranea]